MPPDVKPREWAMCATGYTSYRLSEDQARRRQTERDTSDFAVTGH
jgi:hypothetical protein